MRPTVSQRYRHAAQEFARRVVAELGDQVDAIILYGSVARGEATEDSDIDVLVISPDPAAIRDRLSQLSNAFDYEHGYTTFTAWVEYSTHDFLQHRQLGSPFVSEVLRDGLALYDNGTFARARRETVASR